MAKAPKQIYRLLKQKVMVANLKALAKKEDSIELFNALKNALDAKSAEEKCTLTEEIFYNFKHIKINHNAEILPLMAPTFSYFCQIVPPKKVPQGKYLKNDLNVAHLLHSIAHIEFSAIDLALDCAYRFRNLPLEYYQAWVEVAFQEVHHFLKLNQLLQSIGFRYGDFGVHTLLFDSMKNCDILLDRIALVPRGMEAVGLDVNPFLCAKVQASNHPIKEDFLKVLEIIYQEEISHVSKGNIWFHYLCDKQSIPKQKRAEVYLEILKKHHFSFPKANTAFNTQARIEAGFTQEELTMLRDSIFLSKNPK
ncbi:ferritin-like domain-containing protein [Helicobacter sp. 14348-15]|uniref:ferritin-like domain-containing protein n=1 Tax=Helicobacter colisuis TaxID=2949739 RepID=UPI00202B973F|nr:ferritin-like domain-containing protein [Helicobacter colisuis]